MCVLVLIALFTSCRRHDYRVAFVSVPGMKNQQCASIISNAVVQILGWPNMENSVQVETMVFDLKARTFYVEYESLQMSLKNIEHQIAKAGFEANDIPADTNAAAKLPPECR